MKDRMFKRHERLVSESAKDGYMINSLKERLAVSFSLGIKGDFSSSDYERTDNLLFKRLHQFCKKYQDCQINVAAYLTPFF